MPAKVVSALLGLGLIGAACSTTGSEPGFPAREIGNEYEMLRTAVSYSPLCVGFPLRISRPAEMYRAVLAHPEADRHFKKLLETGQTPGQLYALAGIYFTDPTFFGEAIDPYLVSPDKVISAVGDLYAQAEVSSLAGKIQQGEIPKDLRYGSCPSYEDVMKMFEEKGPDRAQEELGEIFKRGY